jgi:phosphotriesterase-related protein
MRWICPHEHLICVMNEFKGESIAHYPGNLEYLRREITRMLCELREFKVNGLVDPLPIGIGRDEAYVEFCRQVSAATGIHIFLATGLYSGEYWPPWAEEWSAEQLAELFSRELEDGIGRTGVRASVIKAAVWESFGPREEKALAACAAAQLNSGASLHIHSTGCRRQIVEFLAGHGVDPTRIYLAHVDMNTSEEEFLWLAERGVRLVTTNWDFPYHMDQQEAYRLLNVLIRKEHLDKILVSIDFAFGIVNRWRVTIETWDNPDRNSYAYLLTHVLPKLRKAGLTKRHLEAIMHDNPIRMLTRECRELRIGS